MPIKRCTLPSGKQGWKYGDSGKCYSSKKKAIQQMKAIKWRQSQSEETSRLDKILDAIDKIIGKK